MKENSTGKKLKSLRENAEYSPEKLARFLNCTPEQVILWENGEQEPNFNQLAMMCKLYSVTPDEMFSHINVNHLVDNSIKDEFLHEASINRILRSHYL
ncbi:MAG: helix-turn-helix transcriptional regulator [Ruminococcus sp.]